MDLRLRVKVGGISGLGLGVTFGVERFGYASTPSAVLRVKLSRLAKVKELGQD